MLGLVEEKERVLEKYSYVFTEEEPTKKRGRKLCETKKKGKPKESGKASSKEK